MATRSFKQLKGLSKDELFSKAGELEKTLFQLRMQKATGQLKNVAAIWRARKDLARVKTLLTSKTTR